jgi:cytochrome c heme-lyase
MKTGMTSIRIASLLTSNHSLILMWPFTAPRPELVSGSAAPPSACPVDPSARSSYLATNPTSPSPPTSRGAPPTSDTLSRDREVSSIPRWLPPKNPSSTTPASPTAEEDLPLACPARSAPAPPTALDTSYIPTNATEAASVVDKVENWVYPSPSSFFSALERKNRDPSAPDMPVVVPIHNAVNERVWEEVLEWEKREGGSEGSKLVSFVGKPKELSLRARWKGLIG